MLTACTGPQVDVVAPEPTGVASEECPALLGALPDKVADQGSRQVSPENADAAAWGDPAIVVRCGVEKPAGLHATSPCAVIDEIGWFAEVRPDGWRFTTIGRSSYVEVTVPGDYAPEAGVLAELAHAVSTTTTELKPCQ